MSASRLTSRGDASRPAPIAEVGWPGWADQTAVERLRDAIRCGQVGHAYLLSGPKGVGKEALARAFALALCCVSPSPSDPSEPCGVCRACKNVPRGAHPDVETISLASQEMIADKPTRGANLAIETVRRLRAAATLLPLESSRRILIVDDAETMLEPAQQALLKTLEEPPAHVTLLVLADEPEALLETVRSRCQEVAVRPIPQAFVERTLRDRGVDGALAKEISAMSRGRPAWAMAAAQDERALQERRSEWTVARSWVESPRYDRLVTAFKLGDQFAKRRAEVFGVVEAAVQILRAEMIRAAGGSNDGSSHEAPVFGSGVPALVLSRAVAASLQCLADLESNVRPRLALETMVLAWPDPD